MINFAQLQEDITTCGEQQKVMSDQLMQLEKKVATLATKAEMDEMEGRLKEQLGKQLRSIERLEVAQAAASKVVEEMPTIQKELTDRMSDVEARSAHDVSSLSTLSLIHI